MAKILVWMSPESGHLLPTAKFAADLRDRGHRVVYLTCGLIRRELESLGFETMGFFSDDHPAVAARSIFTACSPARHMYEQLWKSFHDGRHYFETFRRQINFAARRIGADLALIDGVFDSILKLNASSLLHDVCPVARVLVHLPYDLSRWDYAAGHSGAVIYLSPREFEIPSQLEPGAVYTEASVFQGVFGSQEPDFWNGHRPENPVVYCSLGTQAELYGSTSNIFDSLFGAAASLPGFTFVLACGSAYRNEYAERAPKCAMRSFRSADGCIATHESGDSARRFRHDQGVHISWHTDAHHPPTVGLARKRRTHPLPWYRRCARKQ
jgi:hypothetical protein